MEVIQQPLPTQLTKFCHILPVFLQNSKGGGALGRWLGHQNEAVVNGLHERGPRELLLPFLCEDTTTKEKSIWKTALTWPCWHVDLGTSSLQSCEKSLLFICHHLRRFAEQPNWTKTANLLVKHTDYCPRHADPLLLVEHTLPLYIKCGVWPTAQASPESLWEIQHFSMPRTCWTGICIFTKSPGKGKHLKYWSNGPQTLLPN